MKPPEQEKATLEACLRELHLPTIRECFEELARQAEQETLELRAVPADAGPTRVPGSPATPA